MTEYWQNLAKKKITKDVSKVNNEKAFEFETTKTKYEEAFEVYQQLQNK
jgi:hypothetical protein